MFRLMNRDSGYLFSSDDLSGIIHSHLRAVHGEVEQIEQNRLLNTAPADLISYLVDKYMIEAPVLRRADWSATEEEIQIDVRNDPNRFIRDRSRPAMIPGQRIVVEVPVDGDENLLFAQASHFTSAPPRAEVRGQHIRLIFNIAHDAHDRDIKKEAERILDEIDQHLSWQKVDLANLRQSLTTEAERAVSARRERILKNQNRVVSLGIPIKNSPDSPKTYAVPEVRRRVVPVLPPATNAAYEPEPVLDLEHYEHILKVVQNMAHVMERSPSAFSSMKEEDLRQHFLVQLNGQFEGGATGETFNVKGKTDILLRAKDRNVFIAECKFWNGPKHYRETIDQVLGYTAWRDTKTAILIFNRGTGLSTVLAGIDSETTTHKNFKRKLDWQHESGFRYVFHHATDPNREFLLTVLVFDVPGMS